MNPTETLADFLVGIKHDDLPLEVSDRVVSLLIDALACAFLGRGGPDTERMERLAADIAGGGDSTVVGSAIGSSVVGATLINSYQITAFNLCDVYRPAHCHLSPAVVAPALAVAERDARSGKELVTALAAGFEAACRVGSALDFRAFREFGWHSPGVIGPFGGAAAVGQLEGLDREAMRNALGLAGSQSGGTMAQWGSPAIKFHQSRGALSGLLAGSLATHGYRAGADVIAAETGGILGVFSGGGAPSNLTEGLGDHWELMNISMKRWPSGSGLQTTVSALFDMIVEHDLYPGQIEMVTLSLPSQAYKAHGTMEWDDKFKAMLSAQYLTSVILHDRNCWTDQFEDQRRLDPDVDRFARDRVRATPISEFSPSEARTEIELTDGVVLTDHREAPKGDPSDPLQLSDIVAKYGDATDESTFVETIDQLTNISAVDDVARLIRRLGAAA